MQGKNQVKPTNLAEDVTCHELRNALSGIYGLIELLESSGLSPMQQSLAAALNRSSRQMDWLIDALYLKGGHIEFQPSADALPANGIDLLEQLIRCHLVSAQNNSIRLLLVVDSGLSENWRVDRRLLWLVLDNLLGNAIKYAGPGEVVLEARQRNPCESAAPGLEIHVRDSGLGIDCMAQERIFEPGVRLADDAMKRDGEGLGLYVCRRIVSELRGTIRYRPDGARGSCFSVSLPDAHGMALRDDAGPTGLLSSMVCVLRLHGNLLGSLAAIIRRIGVSRICCPEMGDAEPADGDCVIEITCPGSGSGFGRNEDLLFTHVSRCQVVGEPVRARRLPEPFLESTVAPALMELAIACRLSGAARGR